MKGEGKGEEKKKDAQIVDKTKMRYTEHDDLYNAIKMR